jgi:plasmid stabilization system protein ParE
MTVSILDAAFLELEEASAFYEGKKEGLGEEFLQEFQKTVQRILDFPEAWSKAGKRGRICPTSRFPYAIVYLAEADKIVIVAVAHQKQRPGYWKKRLKNLPRNP